MKVYFIFINFLVAHSLIVNTKKDFRGFLLLKSSNLIDLNGIKTNGIDVNFFNKEFVSLRGIISTKNIEANEILISVPSQLSLETTNTKPPTPFSNLVTQNLWENSKWDHRLAYKLIYEAFILKEKSNLINWINQLPKTYSTPFYWSDDAIEQLQYDYIENKIKSQRIDWFNLYERFQKQTEIGKSISYDNFIWALESINSRAFSGKYEGTSAAERQRIILFTLILSILWPALQFGSIEQSLATSITVIISILIKDLFISNFFDLKRYVVCPYIDMFNHQSNSSSQTSVSYNYFSDSFEVKSLKSINKNNEVFISYGKQSNDRLLQYYGFIESNNPNDLYDYNKNIIELLLLYDNELSQIISFPNIPSPEDRLNLITNILNSNIDNELYTLKLYNNIINYNSNRISQYVDRYNLHILRALLASNDEWNELQISSLSYSLFSSILDKPLSNDSEDKINNILKYIISKELLNKSTSLEEDQKIFNDLINVKKSNFTNKVEFVDPSGIFNDIQICYLSFRIEKKNLLNKLLNC